MKILILNPILFSGNGDILPTVKSIKDTMIYNMCLGFMANGHDVTLLAVEDYRPIEEETYDFEILFFKNDAKGILPMALPWSFAMNRFIRDNGSKYDLIIASEVFGFHSLAAAKYYPSITLIWQELVKHQKKLYTLPSRFWHNIIVPLYFSKTQIVVPRSQKAFGFISRYLKQTSTKTVDHGININRFKVASSKKKQFISVAQLIQRKNIESIIAKFKELTDQPAYADFKLLLAGRGDQEENLKILVESLNIEDKVEFLGFLTHDELNRYVSQSYASLIDTHNDLNMVSIPEALVSGTPVITNTIPALSEFINTNKLGIAKDNWDFTDLIKVVEDDTYHQNCVEMRETLSNDSAAESLVNIFISSIEIKK